MKNVKRYLAVILTVLIALTSFPLSALAEEIHPDAHGQTDEFIWNYDSETDTLYINTINGNNRLYFDRWETYEKDGFLPTHFTQEAKDNQEDVWNSSFVSNIIVGKDVEILDQSVSFCTYNYRGNTYGYPNLKSVTFEQGSKLKEIGIDVFWATRITSIELPNTLEKIDVCAFTDSNLEEIVIPDSVYYIGNQAFSNAKISRVKLPSYRGNQPQIIEGYNFLNCKNLRNVDFGNTMTTVPEGMFFGSGLKNVVLPDKITAIEYEAFLGCDELESITLSKKLNTIGVYAFDACKKLSDVDFTRVSGKVTIENYSFRECSSLETISMPVAPERIGKYCFKDSGLSSFIYNSVLGEIDEYAFAECKALTSFDFKNVRKIGNYAFQNSGLTKAEFSPNLEEIGVHAFQGTAITELNLKDTAISEIPDEAFKEEANIEKLTLPDNLAKVGEFAFYATGIKELVIPDSVTSLGRCFSAQCKSLEEVMLPEVSSLTYIPSSAFSGCSNLLNVDNFDNIKTIGTYAFANCTQLQWIYAYENNIEAINDYAFQNCESLNVVLEPASDFNENLKSIGQNAFDNCISLDEIDLSACDNLETIGRWSFRGTTNLETFKFPKNKAVEIPEGMLKNSSVRSIIIPTATSIGKDAFNGTRIKEITLPDNCTSIASNAFANCTQLEYARMPYSFTRTSPLYSPFVNTPNLKTIIYPSREKLVYNNTTFTTHGFLAWDGLTVYCYENTDIQRYCEEFNINYIILEEELESNLNDNSGLPITTKGTCTNGTWRVYKKSVNDYSKTLEINVIGDIIDDKLVCDNGREITYKELFENYSICYIVFSEGVTSIPDNLLYVANGGLPAPLYYGTGSITLPSTLKSIGKNAFRNIYGLTKIIIPDSVTEIGEYAFADCVQLHQIQVGRGVTEIKEGTFYGSNPCRNYAYILPDTVKSIGKKAFGGITRFGDGSTNTIWFTIPESVEYIYNDPVNPENNAFGFNSLGVIDDTKVCFKVHYGTVSYDYVKQYCLKYKLLSGTETEEEKNYVPEINYRELNWGYLACENYFTNSNLGIDYSQIRWNYNKANKTLTITAGGFMNQVGLSLGFYRADKTQVMPDDYEVDTIVLKGIRTINYSTKDELVNLSMFNPKNIIVDNSCVQINDNAFKDCERVESFTFPDSATSVSSTVFTNCLSLKAVTFGTGLASIPSNILKDKTKLEYVEIPEGVTSIGGSAFRNCVNLHEINIPDTVVTIGNYAFYKDIGLNKVTLGKSVNNIGQKAFYGAVFCQKLYINSELYKGKSVQTIEKNDSFGMFGDSTTGVSVYYGNTNAINLACFKNVNISELNLGDTVSEVKNINQMPRLSRITVGENNEHFYTHNNALYSVDNALVLAPRTVSEFVIKNGTTEIGEKAFFASRLKSITIPDTVTKIDDFAFAVSPELKAVKFGDSLKEIGQYSFCDCPKLKFVYLPESLETIKEGAFDGTTGLASVIFNEGITTIGNNAFANCLSLKDVVISESVENIGNKAFANCSTLERVYIFDSAIESDIIANSDNAMLYVLAGTTPYALAREYNIPYYAYTDEDCFYDDVAVKLDALAGYLGYCENGHGDIQYLTVYEPSCTQDGFVIGVCEYCSVILEEKHIDACGHNYENTVSIAPTDSTQGVEQYRCTNCNDTYTVYSAALDGESAEKTMCTITGKTVIASSKDATAGETPLEAVSISLGGETLAESDKNGEFTFNLETGTYELVLHYNYGFDRTVYLVITDSDIDTGTIPLIACDWNKDGVIDDSDYALFKLVIGANSDSPSYLSFVDMNNDGKINVKDLVYMNNVKGISSSGFEYPELVIGV